MIRSNAQNITMRPAAPPPAALRDARTVLVVEAPGALRLLNNTPAQQDTGQHHSGQNIATLRDTARQSVVMTQLRMLNPRMLAQVRPDAVIGPLIGDGWDSLDLAIALEEMGYRGSFFILSRPLPRAELVLREVRACCPLLTITLVETA